MKDSLPPDSASRAWPWFLDNGSEMGRRILARDWSQTPLGPIEAWPQPLRTALGMCLSTRFPMYIYWGPERFQLYNDPGIPIMGDRHPHTAMAPVREVFPEIWDVIRRMFDDIERTGQPTWSENQLLPLERNGIAEERYFTFSYSPILDDAGRVAGIYTTAMETTGQVLGQRRLRTLQAIVDRAAGSTSVEAACREALNALGDNSADVPFTVLYLTDADGSSASRVGARGVEPESAGLPSRVDLRAASDAPSGWILAPVASTGRAQLVTDLKTRLRALPDPKGLGAPHSALVLPLATAQGESAFGFLVVGLSRWLALDGEYLSFLELAAGAMVRTASSARTQQEARERAERLAAVDRAKTTFFSNVSHEFRTPLTLMMGPLEDALNDSEEALGPRQRERLVLLRRNAVRLLKLVNTLLEFSRLEAGRAQASFEPVDLSTFTRELVSHFESTARRAGLTLTRHAPPLPEPVWVDPASWEKVVFNLLSNALKFTFEGGITVSLFLEGAEVVLRVEDTGTGIPERELSHLFERFHRVEGARSRSHEGSGIGLALVQELVKLHGGSVGVESTLGQGSAFTVRIPRGHSHLPSEHVRQQALPTNGSHERAEGHLQEVASWLPAEPSEGVPADASAGRPLSGARVLVADDNADLRAYLQSLLAPHFSVETVGDGHAALEAARARKPDLILSDVMMPVLGGFGLLRALRADPSLRAIPFILLSARAGEEANVEGLEAGADDYLVKPFSARELVARVSTQLEMARVRRQVAAHEAREAMLEEAVRARDDFLSVASHELKTPLAAFRLQLDLLERALGAEVRTHLSERLSVTHRQVQRLASVVEMLLDVSQITSGHLRLRLEELDLATLVTESVSRIREEMMVAGNLLTLTATAAVVGHFDRERMEQVVRNLLSNAMKFGQGKPIEVSIGLAGGLARLRVVDHGIGIPPQEHERIFGRFERAVSASHYGGLGLGLWMTRQVAEAHGGSVDVADTAGGGATFVVELPLAPETMSGEAQA